jgi:hypothetical protein
MADEIARQQWEVLKSLFGVAVAQLAMIATLTQQYEQHEIMFRIIAKELEVDLPAPVQQPDPAALERMAQGVSELEEMFKLDEGDQPPALN